MKKLSLATQIYFGSAFLALLVSGVLGFILYDSVQERLKADLESDLRMVATIGAERLHRTRLSSVEKVSGSRLELFSDPSEDSSPEVLAALAFGEGIAEREGAFWYAKAVHDQGRVIGVVRATAPLARVGQDLRPVRLAWLWGSLGAVLFGILMGWVAVRMVSKPVASIARAAQVIQEQEDGPGVIERSSPNEIESLGTAFRRLVSQLRSKVGTVEQDRSQLQAMLSSMVEGVVAVDDEARLLFCNEAAVKMLLLPGWKIGQPFLEVIRLSEAAAAIDRARSEARTVHGEVTLIRDERERVFDLHATPFALGRRRGVVLGFHDISSLRQLERVRKDFAANASHELKTPLTAIKGYTKLLLGKKEVDGKTAEKFLKRVDENVDRLVTLAEDLLAISRLESMEPPAAPKVIDLGEIVRDAVDRYVDQAKQKGLSLRSEQTEPFSYVLADEHLLDTILNNLLDNALKYTNPSGSILVRVVTLKPWVVLEVEDTGIGIPPEDQDRVFERFYRVDKARSREQGGTGLGLSIVKHAVQSLQGEVEVRSQIGHGSVFSVRLPAAASPSPIV